MKNMTKEDLQMKREELGASLVRKLLAKLRRVEFNSHCYCYGHSKFCPVSPRFSPLFESWHWIDAAGTACTSFTVVGKFENWMSPNTLPTLVWAQSAYYFEPDQVVHECVRAFPVDLFDEIFENRGATGEVPKCQCTRQPVLNPADYRYSRCSQIFSPSDLGLCVNRERVYSTLSLTPVADANQPTLH